MYQETIREELARTGRLGVNPRHVEAWMRVEHPTLDHLSRSAFLKEVRLAVQCAELSSCSENDALARSLGI